MTAILIGVVVAGCGTGRPAPRLPAGALPYLGIRCGIPNSIRCDRIGVGVVLALRATRVVVWVEGRRVPLTPPAAGSDVWEGDVYGLGPRRGPLAAQGSEGRWAGEPPVYAHVRVTAWLRRGSRAVLSGGDYLHAGYG